jgi:hypothetical protein
MTLCNCMSSQLYDTLLISLMSFQSIVGSVSAITP